MECLFELVFIEHSADDYCWRFTGCYGFPEDSNKHKTCQLIKQLGENNSKPWVCGGDWNMMLWANEKQGGADFNYGLAAQFREALDSCALFDLYYTGYPFTWNNNQGGEANLQERLDRFFANQEWKDMYGGAFVSHLDKRRSDHLPLCLSLRPKVVVEKAKKRRKLFRFEEMWLRDESCEEMVVKAWEAGSDVISNLARTSHKLQSWSRDRFGNFQKELKDCANQMKVFMEEPQTDDVIAKMKSIDIRMDELEEREEAYWRQRSRQDWLRHGDRNTSFFHNKAKQRRQRNNIESIKDAAGNVYDMEEEIMELFSQHFETFFSSSGEVDVEPILSKVQTRISNDLVYSLQQPFSGEEITNALKQMHPTKAPGPDGMCALFYQKFWYKIGPDVIDKVLAFLNNNADIGTINQTYLALIPKKKVCESPVDYRPISLCNVLYKLVAKVLANRLI